MVLALYQKKEGREVQNHPIQNSRYSTLLARGGKCDIPVMYLLAARSLPSLFHLIPISIYDISISIFIASSPFLPDKYDTGDVFEIPVISIMPSWGTSSVDPDGKKKRNRRESYKANEIGWLASWGGLKLSLGQGVPAF